MFSLSKAAITHQTKVDSACSFIHADSKLVKDRLKDEEPKCDIDISNKKERNMISMRSTVSREIAEEKQERITAKEPESTYIDIHYTSTL